MKPALIAASAALTLAACNDSNAGPPAPPAEDLLTFVFFHVDPAQPSSTQAPPLPANPKNQIFNQQYNQSYDQLMRNRFGDDGLAQRAIASFLTFRNAYCKTSDY